jgi:D-alanyl-D-alanine carboxypeptidase
MLAALVALIAALAPLAANAQSARAAVDGRPLLLTAEAVLLLDPEGRTLFAKNPEEERAPASLVKLMTLYLAFEDIEAGRAELDELVPVSRYASLTPKARMGLRAGELVPLHVLLEGVAIASANDAATALAERLAGDE